MNSLCCLVQDKHRCLKCGAKWCGQCVTAPCCDDVQLRPSPFTFAFGSMHGESQDNKHETEMGHVAMRLYRPRPTSKSAKFLKLCEVLNGAPRCFYSDSACVSNLSQNKANLIAYDKKTKKYYPTETGRKYLEKHPEIELDVKKWIREDSTWRGQLPDALKKLKEDDYDGVAKILRKVKREAWRTERRSRGFS